jgi:hypothetical protein
MKDDVKELGTNFAGVIKALVRDTLYEREQYKSSDSDLRGRVGDPWKDEEERQLVAELEIFLEIAALIHRRNINGIRARVGKLTKVW